MLNELIKLTTRKKKRLGRGVGSGKGAHPLIKRLPYARGKFHFRSLNKKPVVVKVEQLDFVKDGIVTIETLVASGLVKSVQTPVKIVAGGTSKVKEIHGIAVTAAAKEALEKAGTTIHTQ